MRGISTLFAAILPGVESSNALSLVPRVWYASTSRAMSMKRRDCPRSSASGGAAVYVVAQEANGK